MSWVKIFGKARFLAYLVLLEVCQFLVGHYFEGKLQEHKYGKFMHHYHPFYESLMDDLMTHPLV